MSQQSNIQMFRILVQGNPSYRLEVNMETMENRVLDDRGTPLTIGWFMGLEEREEDFHEWLRGLKGLDPRELALKIEGRVSLIDRVTPE